MKNIAQSQGDQGCREMGVGGEQGTMSHSGGIIQGGQGRPPKEV